MCACGSIRHAGCTTGSAALISAPDWVLKTFVTLLLLRVPLALFFAWTFGLTLYGSALEVPVHAQTDSQAIVLAARIRRIDVFLSDVETQR